MVVGNVIRALACLALIGHYYPSNSNTPALQISEIRSAAANVFNSPGVLIDMTGNLRGVTSSAFDNSKAFAEAELPKLMEAFIAANKALETATPESLTQALDQGVKDAAENVKAGVSAVHRVVAKAVRDVNAKKSCNEGMPSSL